MTHLAVVPYRNPLLQARSMMTLDVLSGGRAELVVGTGYPRSEFAALGIDFGERNALFDEAIDVITQAWTGNEVSFDGLHFRALGQQMLPLPVQRDPPLWMGGNSRTALERVARWGRGWSAMVGAPPEIARTVRSPTIADPLALARAMETLACALAEHGRVLDDVEILVSPPHARVGTVQSAQQCVEALASWIEAGVTWLGVSVSPGDPVEALDAVQQFAEDVVGPLRPLGRSGSGS